MNWIRGLTRLWVFASLTFTVVVGFGMWRHAVNACHYENSWATKYNCDNLGRLFLYIAGVSVPVSFAVFIVGAGLIWVMRGFQWKGPRHER